MNKIYNIWFHPVPLLLFLSPLPSPLMPVWESKLSQSLLPSFSSAALIKDVGLLKVKWSWNILRKFNLRNLKILIICLFRLWSSIIELLSASILLHYSQPTLTVACQRYHIILMVSWIQNLDLEGSREITKPVAGFSKLRKHSSWSLFHRLLHVLC